MVFSVLVKVSLLAVISLVIDTISAFAFSTVAMKSAAYYSSYYSAFSLESTRFFLTSVMSSSTLWIAPLSANSESKTDDYRVTKKAASALFKNFLLFIYLKCFFIVPTCNKLVFPSFPDNSLNTSRASFTT